MANVTMNVKVVNLFKTTAEWEQITDVITKGVLCVETTTDNKVKIKVGDGVKTYDALPYASEVDLSDYSTTAQVTQAINDAIAALGNLMTVKGVVATTDDLPSTGNKTGDVYFVGSVGDTGDSYAEYVWTEDNKWEYIGKITEVDLSDYYTKTKVDELLANKVDTTEGKTLTSNDFTDELKTKLDGIAEGATAITVDETLTDDGVNPVQGKAIKTALDDKVATTDTLILNCTL